MYFLSSIDLLETGNLIYTIAIALIIPCFLFGIIASILVRRTFNKYNTNSSVPYPARDVARKFLNENGLNSVSIRPTRGHLTDFFDPTKGTVNLSETVYNSNSISALGVACHECGHAVQTSKKYVFSTLRSKMVPILGATNSLMWPLFIIGFIFGFASPYTAIGRLLLLIGLIAMGTSLVFALVTLPTEFDASRRAYAYLSDFMPREEAVAVKRVLNAAAMTYVASFMTSATHFLLILGMLFIGRGSRR